MDQCFRVTPDAVRRLSNSATAATAVNEDFLPSRSLVSGTQEKWVVASERVDASIEDED